MFDRRDHHVSQEEILPMRWLIVPTACTLVLLAAQAGAADDHWTVHSPDGEVVFELRLGSGAGASGALTYTVSRRHEGQTREILRRSPLGVRRDDQSFLDGLRLVEAAPPRAVNEAYVAPHGKRRNVQHRASEQVFSFTNARGARLDVIVSVANDGAAFRYRFPEQDETTRSVIEEASGFAIPSGSRAWMMPQSPPGRYTPAYEELFVEVPSGTAAPTPSGWDFPALFRAPGGHEWILLTESGVDDANCATRLGSAPADGVYRIRLPEEGEGRGVGSVRPSSTLPWTLPWRVIVVGRTAAAIAESTLVDDLAAPTTMTDTSWIRPGRAAWSWWSDDDSPKNEAKLNAFTDLAAEMGWEYSLVDANWNLMDPAALQRVLAHAKEKQVGILLWYNSGGAHNDVTEQPRDRMDTRDVRRREFEKLREWGVKGVKVDFWQSDKQDRIQQYLGLLRDAADFHLMVDFHGCTLPRGWSRTYPHLMSMEAVQGAEQYKFNPKYAVKAAWHNTVLAFTRNVVGGMDYTPVTFSDSKFPHQTTYGHELALSVVFESGLQHFADSVDAYHALPEAANDFLKAVPAAWDETRVIAGEPGTLAVFARRSGKDWFIGGISGLDTAQPVSLDLSFLGAGPHSLTLITDGSSPRALASSAKTLAAGEALRLDLLGRGGFVARVTGR
jgi:hypothetical protein